MSVYCSLFESWASIYKASQSRSTELGSDQIILFIIILRDTLHDQKHVETCSSNISFQNHGHSFGVGPPFASLTASTLLGRLSTRCWNIAAGTCFHSATGALVRLGTDVGRRHCHAGKGNGPPHSTESSRKLLYAVCCSVKISLHFN